MAQTLSKIDGKPVQVIPVHRPAAPEVNTLQKAKAARPVQVIGARPPLSASYQYNKALKQVIITLVRPDTGEVVLQIPQEKVLNLIAILNQLSNQALDTSV